MSDLSLNKDNIAGDPISLRAAVDELRRIGRDPNHTDEDLREAMERIHAERKRAIESNRDYADMLRRKAEAEKREIRARVSSKASTMPHGGAMSWQRPRTTCRPR